MNSPLVLPRVMKTNKQKPIVNPIDPMDTRVIIPTTTAKQKPIEIKTLYSQIANYWYEAGINNSLTAYRTKEETKLRKLFDNLLKHG